MDWNFITSVCELISSAVMFKKNLLQAPSTVMFKKKLAVHADIDTCACKYVYTINITNQSMVDKIDCDFYLTLLWLVVCM